ncbi:MAG: hypothetical protein DWI59_06505, partial [Chloroflexi bacterium]
SIQAPKTEPVSVAKIEGTDQMRLTLQADAAKRLDITTAPVREETIVQTRQFGGEVIAVTADTGVAIVQVNLTENDVKSVQRDVPAFVLPLSGGSKTARVQAQPATTTSPFRLSGPFGTTFYEISNTDMAFVPQQLVFVEIPLAGSGETRKIIPYAALLYDPTGKTWVYTNPTELVFVRQPILIETIAGDDVILGDGPPTGTSVVTVGAAELYGAEFGVGK